MTDEDIIKALRAVDEDEDVTVTTWEATFIEDVAYGDPLRDLTGRQRLFGLEIIEAYA